jgi:hypothetical protein
MTAVSPLIVTVALAIRAFQSLGIMPPSLILNAFAIKTPFMQPDGSLEYWQVSSGRPLTSAWVRVCPSGHRNAHWWIVKLCTRSPAGKTTTSSPQSRQSQVEAADYHFAVEALSRFAPHGSLLELTAAHQWGQA